MPRSQYIYLIYEKFSSQGLPVAAKTVKREAYRWVERRGGDFEKYLLIRFRDRTDEVTEMEWEV